MGLTISIVPTVHGGLWSCDRLPALPRTLVAKPKHPENRGHSQIPPLTTSGAGRNLAYEVIRHGVGVARSRADGAASSRIVLMLVKKPSNQLLQLELTGRGIHSRGLLNEFPLDFSRKIIPLHDHRRAHTPHNA